MTKHMMPMLGLLALAIGGTAGAADAPPAGADCAGHFTVEGSFFAGKKFSTWADFAAVSKADLYTRVYTNIAKDGWNITSSDKEAGIISASQSVSYGKGTVAPLTIVIETAGTGSKATATFHIGGGQATKEDTVKQKLCSYFG
jgi:hypothetical protein